MLAKHSCSLASYQNVQENQNLAKQRLASFSSIINTKALSKGMALKAAESGLVYHHLQLCYKHAGRDGICSLFSDESSGRMCITKSK